MNRERINKRQISEFLFKFEIKFIKKTKKAKN
jgi:hypothetical protein